MADSVQATHPTFTATAPLAAFDTALRHHRAVIDETRVAVVEGGILMEAIDTTNVAVTGAWIPADRCPTYIVREEGVFGVETQDIKQALTLINSDNLDTVITIRNADSEDDNIPSDVTNGLTVSYKVPTPDDSEVKYSDTFGALDPASIR
jgi:DNA polymerase III sliding clamp (beta) subunit (PCNA family)